MNGCITRQVRNMYIWLFWWKASKCCDRVQMSGQLWMAKEMNVYIYYSSVNVYVTVSQWAAKRGEIRPPPPAASTPTQLCSGIQCLKALLVCKANEVCVIHSTSHQRHSAVVWEELDHFQRRPEQCLVYWSFEFTFQLYLNRLSIYFRQLFKWTELNKA